jgi:glycosyltransferase involved in cell wall biosynthesis
VNIIFVTRLFSGIENSLLTKKWSPTGVPTIYKMVEALDCTHNTQFIFTAKDSGEGYSSSWDLGSNVKFKLDKINQEITVVSGINRFPSFFGRKIRIILREITQFIYVISRVIIIKPDVLYCDSSNIIIGSIVSRFFNNISVVYRVMGVNQYMQRVVNNNGIIPMIYKWLYRSPFKLVICTQDGSGVENWTYRAFKKNIDVKILINGVDDFYKGDDLNNNIKKLIDNKISILFVGKLESYKGCIEFINAIEIVLNKGVKNIHTLVIGTGTKKERLKDCIKRAKIEDYVTLIDSLPHSQILSLHKYTDIYVSMNHLGNLSNANLEAINSNDCMIIPETQYEKGIDIVTSQLLGESVVRVPINRPEILADNLIELINDNYKRELLSISIGNKKKKFIRSWSDRINYEINLFSLLNS